ncbi:MAG: hypothetical protein ACFE8M_04435 [Candidatus Hermodarchaeota archaeon]
MKEFNVGLLYLVFSGIFLITFFFPYYETWVTGWGLPCSRWYSIIGFFYLISNFINFLGFIGVLLLTSSFFLFYLSKLKIAILLVTIGNILIGVSLINLHILTKDGVLMLRYDVYLLFNIKISYKIAIFDWSISIGISFLLIIIEIEKKKFYSIKEK